MKKLEKILSHFSLVFFSLSFFFIFLFSENRYHPTKNPQPSTLSKSEYPPSLLGYRHWDSVNPKVKIISIDEVNKKVTLEFYCDGADFFKVSSNPNFTDAEWDKYTINYRDKYSYETREGDDLVIFYVVFKNKKENYFQVSKIVHAIFDINNTHKKITLYRNHYIDWTEGKIYFNFHKANTNTNETDYSLSKIQSIAEREFFHEAYNLFRFLKVDGNYTVDDTLYQNASFRSELKKFIEITKFNKIYYSDFQNVTLNTDISFASSAKERENFYSLLKSYYISYSKTEDYEIRKKKYEKNTLLIDARHLNLPLSLLPKLKDSENKVFLNIDCYPEKTHKPFVRYIRNTENILQGRKVLSVEALYLDNNTTTEIVISKRYRKLIENHCDLKQITDGNFYILVN